MTNSFEPLFHRGDGADPLSGSDRSWLAAIDSQQGFTLDPRFGGQGAEPVDMALGKAEAVLAEAFAEGERKGREDALAELAGEERIQARLKLALSGLDKAMQNQLTNRLAETVAALTETALAPLVLDTETLQRRCVTAASMIGEGIIDATLRLHPDDIEMLDKDFAATWHIFPDDELERGTVVFDMAEGAVRDGPAEWRAAMREALGLC